MKEDNNSYYSQGYKEGYETGYAQGDKGYNVYKNIDLKNETNWNAMQSIAIDCTDLPEYSNYSAADFLIIPTSIYEQNVGYESVHRLDNVQWEYNDGILTIKNAVLHLINGSDSQHLDLWYSSFDIYIK